MPYTPSNVPSYVPKSKAAQWAAIWNSVYNSCMKESGATKKKCEGRAFERANGKIKSQGNNEDLERIKDSIRITKLGWSVQF